LVSTRFGKLPAASNSPFLPNDRVLGYGGFPGQSTIVFALQNDSDALKEIHRECIAAARRIKTVKLHFVGQVGQFGLSIVHMPTTREFLNAKEVARMLGISRQTLYNWLNEGRIPEPRRHPTTKYPQWEVQDVELIRRLRVGEAL
jgi:predicted DNA-binding transcriptional regulator AlpA